MGLPRQSGKLGVEKPSDRSSRLLAMELEEAVIIDGSPTAIDF